MVEKIDWPTVHTPVIPKTRVKGENLEGTDAKRKFEKKTVDNEPDGGKKQASGGSQAGTESETTENDETAEKHKKKKIDIHV